MHIGFCRLTCQPACEQLDDALDVERDRQQRLDRVDLDTARGEVGDGRERRGLRPVALALLAPLLARVDERDDLDVGVVEVRADVQVVDAAEPDEGRADRAVVRGEGHGRASGASCSMNSRRMPPGASTNAIRRVPNAPSTTVGPPHHGVAVELGVQIVGEQRRMQEPLGGEGHHVLVDRAGEERDHHGSEEDVGALTAVPVHAVSDLAAGAGVERACRVEIGHLDRQVRHRRDRHACASREIDRVA